MKRVIVTGATGFVGANLVRRLLHDGHELHLLVRPGYRPWRIESIGTMVNLHVVSLTDRKQLQDTVTQVQPHWIFHLATHGAYSYQTNLGEMIQTNFIGTINLVEVCCEIGFEAFVNTGSSSEYGYKNQAHSETEWLEPNSHYAVTKASATLFCRYTAQSKGINLSTLRLYSVYGAYEEPTRLIPTLIRLGNQNKLPPLVNPETARDYIYVDDVVDAYILAANHSGGEVGGVYNVGTGIQTRLHEVVALVRQVLQVQMEPVWGSMADRNWDTNLWVANNQKIRSELGWEPKYDFRSGFEAAVTWFKNHPDLLQVI
jgi:nucleoside-diphosphate-sugar epimerase